MVPGFRKCMLLPVVVVVLAFAYLCPGTSYSLEIVIEIEVAPNTPNIQSEGEVVTIHTDINYGDVDGPSVCLNEVPIQSWKSDNQGNFVAKFSIEDIKSLVGSHTGPYDVLMDGYTKDGDYFWGEDTIRVVNNVPKGR